MTHTCGNLGGKPCEWIKTDGCAFCRKYADLDGEWHIGVYSDGEHPACAPAVEIVPGHQSARFASERQEKRGLK